MALSSNVRRIKRYIYFFFCPSHLLFRTAPVDGAISLFMYFIACNGSEPFFCKAKVTACFASKGLFSFTHMHLHVVYCCHCKPHQPDLKRPAEVEKDLQKYKEAFGSTNLMESLALRQQWTGFFGCSNSTNWNKLCTTKHNKGEFPT